MRLRPKFAVWTAPRLAKAAKRLGRQAPFPTVVELAPQLAALVRFPAPGVTIDLADLTRERSLRTPFPGITQMGWNTLLSKAKPLKGRALQELLTTIADHPDERLPVYLLAALTGTIKQQVRYEQAPAVPMPHPLRWWLAEAGVLPVPTEAPTTLGPILTTRITELVTQQLTAGETLTPLQRQVIRSWQQSHEHRPADLTAEERAAARAVYGGTVTPSDAPPIIKRIETGLGQVTQTLTTPEAVQAWCATLTKEEIEPGNMLAGLLHTIPAFQTEAQLRTVLYIDTIGTDADAASLAEAYVTHPLMRDRTTQQALGQQILSAVVMGGLERHQGIQNSQFGWVDGVLPEVLQRLDRTPQLRPALEAHARHLMTTFKDAHQLNPDDGALQSQIQHRDLFRWPVLWRIAPTIVHPDQPLAPSPLDEQEFTWLRWGDGPHLTQALTQLFAEFGTMDPDDDYILDHLMPLLEQIDPTVFRTLPPTAWKGALRSPCKPVRLWAIQRLGRTQEQDSEAPAPARGLTR